MCPQRLRQYCETKQVEAAQKRWWDLQAVVNERAGFRAITAELAARLGATDCRAAALQASLLAKEEQLESAGGALRVRCRSSYCQVEVYLLL